MAISYNNIGLVHDNKGEYDKALEHYQKALAIVLKQLGAEHPSVARSYNNMAYVYEAKKDLAKAKEYWEKAYDLPQETGPEPSITKYQDRTGRAEGVMGAPVLWSRP